MEIYMTDFATRSDTSEFFLRYDSRGRLRCCFGPRKLRIQSNSWVKQDGIPIQQWTGCEYCYRKGIYSDKTVIPYLNRGGIPWTQNINCDTTDKSDIHYRQVSKNGCNINVNILGKKSERGLPKEWWAPSLILSSERDKASNGIGIMDMPTCSNFEFTFDSPGEWYTISIERGDGKKVIINDSRTIYYNGRQSIDTMRTGSKDSFFFYAASEEEKKIGVAPVGTSESNKWYFTFVKYDRIEPQRYRGGYDHYTDICHHGITRGAIRLATRGATTNTKGISGGATISGGSYTGHKNTTSIPEGVRYVEKETVRLSIQIITTESQEELKYANSMFNNRFLVAARKQIEELREDIGRMEDKLQEKRVFLKEKEEEIQHLSNNIPDCLKIDYGSHEEQKDQFLDV